MFTASLFCATNQADMPDSMGMRLVVAGVCLVLGIVFIFVGRQNIKSRIAEETGSRRGVNKMLGQSNTYEGGKAVLVGWIRVVCGIAAIIFGIVFIFVGPFLKDMK